MLKNHDNHNIYKYVSKQERNLSTHVSLPTVNNNLLILHQSIHSSETTSNHLDINNHRERTKKYSTNHSNASDYPTYPNLPTYNLVAN